MDDWIAGIKQLVTGGPATFIIVDALDECPQAAGERRKLLKFIEAIMNLHMNGLHVFVTSRKEGDIDKSLRTMGQFGPFGIQNANVDKDILSHVKFEIEQDVIMQKWPTVLQEEVEAYVESRAQGMWVDILVFFTYATFSLV